MLTIRTRNVNNKTRAQNANRKVPSMLSTMTYEVTPLQSKRKQGITNDKKNRKFEGLDRHSGSTTSENKVLSVRFFCFFVVFFWGGGIVVVVFS